MVMVISDGAGNPREKVIVTGGGVGDSKEGRAEYDKKG